MLFMVLMAQGSHFVEAIDHPVVAVEAEHALVKAAKAAHKTSDRNAEAVKAELQGSLSTSVDADRDMHAVVKALQRAWLHPRWLQRLHRVATWTLW